MGLYMTNCTWLFVKNNPDDYEIYHRYNGKHAALFSELGKR